MIYSQLVICAIIQDVPLGKYKVKIGLQLRQAMFLNGVLYNSEVWHSPTKEDISKLEVIDHQLMRAIFDAHSKTPIEFLYLETSEKPLSYIISSRRLMYWHHINQKEDNELVKKVFKAQHENPTRGDFSELVNKDMEMLGTNIDENILLNLNKAQFKTFIKKHINEASFKHLKSLQKKHTKIRNISYNEYKSQPYISDTKFSNKMVSVLFSMRSSMTRGIKNNFSSLYVGNKTCPLLECKSQTEDDQPHLLKCFALKTHLSQPEQVQLSNIFYNDIFGPIEKQREAAQILTRLLGIREELLQEDSLPVDLSTGPRIITIV